MLADSWDVECSYRNHYRYGYTCSLSNLITNDFKIINGEEDQKVTGVEFKNSALATVPSQVFITFPELTHFDQEATGLELIESSSFIGGDQISWIDLDQNKLKEIGPLTFRETPLLTILEITENQIERVDPKAFAGNRKIEIISLGKNKIKTLHEDTFATLDNLDVIYLQLNLLEYIPEKLFRNTLKLRGIELENNRINAMSSETFSGLSIIEVVRLSGNPCIDQDFVSSKHLIKGALENCDANFKQAVTERIETEKPMELKVADHEVPNNDTKNNEDHQAIFLRIRHFTISILFICGIAVLGSVKFLEKGEQVH